jgi:hypothetical protein
MLRRRRESCHPVAGSCPLPQQQVLGRLIARRNGDVWGVSRPPVWIDNLGLRLRIESVAPPYSLRFKRIA